MSGYESFQSVLVPLILAMGAVLVPGSDMWAQSRAAAFPVQGLHLAAPAPEQVPLLARFIREALPREGVSVLVLEINYHYRFRSYPRLASSDALSKEHVGELLAAARTAGVRVIPQLNCLGHQSWEGQTFSLLTEFPELDETPGRYPNNEGIYCRSYCPRHPRVHEIVFALIDELAEAFQAEAFHVGMDEVFLLGEEGCPRCQGMSKAQLFADEVRTLHRHLVRRNLRMWMWGDRFMEAEGTGIGKWEASMDGTHPALDKIPKDIVICDWHYDSAPPTAGYFALKGFSVVSSPWRKSGVALAQLEMMRSLRDSGNSVLAGRALGVLQTTWTDPTAFIRAYYGENSGREAAPDPRAQESAHCFKQLFAALRGRN